MGCVGWQKRSAALPLSTVLCQNIQLPAHKIQWQYDTGCSNLIGPVQVPAGSLAVQSGDCSYGRNSLVMEEEEEGGEKRGGGRGGGGRGGRGRRKRRREETITRVCCAW